MMPRHGQYTLLLVEDENVLRNLVASYLRAEGYSVVEAADGPQGVDRFNDSGPFDLVLLDLNLPTFSGVEVCRRIKRVRPLQPVMICSAAILPDHETELARMGVHHFLTKPYHPEDLLTHIHFEVHPVEKRAQEPLLNQAQESRLSVRTAAGPFPLGGRISTN
jgi:DNA-binding response OmpR family regulator